MSIIVVGLNHRTAPVELREKLATSHSALARAFAGLRSQSEADGVEGAAPPLAEMVIVSTCNRLEVYAIAARAQDGAALIAQHLATHQGVAPDRLDGHLYTHTEAEAVRHLMRVAAGLDSMILGESQILGQVSEAYDAAREAGMTGPLLSHLFNQAIHAGKRARSETPISRYTTSVSHAGALLLHQTLGGRRDGHILLVGGGEMAALAASALHRFGLCDLTFINRTQSRAEALAESFGGRALPWFQLDEALADADAVICATGAPHPILYRADLEAVLPARGGRPLAMLDLAVPRDIDPAVRGLPGVTCFDIDDLKTVVDANMALRRAAVPQIEAIIHDEAVRFDEWLRGRQVTPVIKNLRDWAQGIAEDELIQALNRLSDADERTRQVVSRMAHRLVNRLLHEPTSRLRMQANAGNAEGYAHAVRELFALHDLDPFECDPSDHRCALVDQSGALGRPCNLQCILPVSAGQPV